MALHAPLAGARTGERAARAWWTVLAVWAASTVAALWLIARFGSNVPFTDGWDMVPAYTGEQPVTVEWLWSQHNEHRIPLPRLMLLALNSAVIDVRIPMVFDALATSGLALALVLALQCARGGARLTDAFVPLVLLHLGHAVNLLWGWQVQFYASALLSLVVLLALVRMGPDPTRAALWSGAAVLLMPLCGGNGVALVPPLAAWVGWIGWRHRHADDPAARRRARCALGLAGLSLLVGGLYFVGYESVPYHPRNGGIAGKLLASSKVVTVGLGPAVREPWPGTGMLGAGVLVGAGAVLLRAWRWRPLLRERTAGLLAYGASLGLLAGAIGIGRDGFEPRYTLLLAPLWCAAYAVFSLHGPTPATTAGRGALLTGALLLLGPNTAAGLEYARAIRGAFAAFERDMTDGVPLDRLVARHHEWLHPHHDVPLDYLPMLRRAGVGSFAALRDPAPLRAVPLPLASASLREVAWVGSTARLTGYRARIELTLPEPLRVRGFRLRYRHQNDVGQAPLVFLAWRGAGQTFTGEDSTYASPTGDRANWERGAWTRLDDDATTMHVLLDDDRLITDVRLTPDFRPGVFEVLEFVALVDP